MVRHSGGVLNSEPGAYRCKEFLQVNCKLLWVRRYLRMPNGTSQWSKKRFTLGVDVFLDVGIARASLK